MGGCFGGLAGGLLGDGLAVTGWSGRANEGSGAPAKRALGGEGGWFILSRREWW